MGAIAGHPVHPVQAYAEKKDFSTVMAQTDQSQEEAIRERIHLTSLVAAIQQRTALNEQQQQQQQSNASRKVAKAQHMSLVEAADAAREGEAYDKILILLHHGEAQHQVFERRWVEAGNGSIDNAQYDEDYPADPMLSGKVSNMSAQTNLNMNVIRKQRNMAKKEHSSVHCSFFRIRH